VFIDPLRGLNDGGDENRCAQYRRRDRNGAALPSGSFCNPACAGSMAAVHPRQHPQADPAPEENLLRHLLTSILCALQIACSAAGEDEAEKLETIRGAALAAGNSNLDVREAKVDGTNLPEGCCDVIVMRHVYHYLTEPAAVNQDVLRALFPGGLFVVVDFPPTWLLRLFTPDGVDEARQGHGMETTDVLEELRAAGFAEVQAIESWNARRIAPDTCALVLRKPTAR
jgi:SAM-dependent methyltransferase